MRHHARLAPVLALILAACATEAPENGQAEIEALDQQLAEGTSDNGADPMLSRALQDQIMVDPQLAARANADAVRPPSQPYAAPLPPDNAEPAPAPDGEALRPAPAPASGKPCRECRAADTSLTLASLAERQPSRSLSGCAAAVRYGAGWANRLPADLPLHPAARVIEAAGADTNGCALRIASFTVAQPVGTMVDWYYTRATRAGFSAEHQVGGGRHVLGGTRARDGGAYVIYLSARPDGGTAVDLIANNGS